MKQFLIILVSFFTVSLVSAQNILPKPNPPRLVTDMANVLSQQQKDFLERKLVAIDDSSSNQIAVVLIKTLNDYPIEEYSTKLFRDWGIGNKKTNNGILLIAAIDDHKVRIEVGYGLEGAIPDITVASIIRNDIAPKFKAGDYFNGIDVATTSIAKAAVGEYKVARQKEAKGKGGSGIFTFIIILIIVVVIVSSSRGGPGGGMMSRRGVGGLAETLFWTSLLSGGGRGGGGGGWGGGDSGGGFGGFGGGSSGGGGASGSW